MERQRMTKKLGAVLGVIAFLFCAQAWGATVQVEAVSAAKPGQRPLVQAALKAYEQILNNTAFGSFSSEGIQALNLGAGESGSASVGGYKVDVTVRSAAGGQVAIHVTLFKGGNPIGAPVSYTLTRGEPLHMEVGSPALRPSFSSRCVTD